MNQPVWIAKWLQGRDWRRALNDVRSFLDPWYFYVSATGHLYARPRQSVGSRDVQEFLRRVDVIGEDRLPDSMAFDFTRLEMSPAKWRRMSEMLREYAAEMDATSVQICASLQHGGYVLIVRNVRATNEPIRWTS